MKSTKFKESTGTLRGVQNHVGSKGELERLLTRLEVAELLRISVSTLKLLELKGEAPPCLRIGRLVRFDPEGVREWIQQLMNQSGN